MIVVCCLSAPVPGGCNMEFDIEVSPYQRLMLTNSTIIIDSQPASAPLINGLKLPCEKNLVTYETYRLYTDESDFNNETYFSTIIKMLTVDDIIQNAVKVFIYLCLCLFMLKLINILIKIIFQIAISAGKSPMRKVYSSYPGTGSAYVMIATFGNHSSAYVPIFSYGCTPFSTEISCDYLS